MSYLNERQLRDSGAQRYDQFTKLPVLVMYVCVVVEIFWAMSVNGNGVGGGGGGDSGGV